MNLIDTVPAGHGDDLVKYSFGNMPFVDTYTFAEITTIGGFSFVNWNNLDTLLFPNLTTVDPTNIQGGGLAVNNTSALTVQCAMLTTIGGNLLIANNASLSSISFPDLATIDHVTVGGTPIALAVAGNASLLTISFPALVSCQGQVEFSQAAVGSTLNFPLLTTINGNLIAPSANFVTFSFPSLVTVNGDLDGAFNPHLTTISLPNWIPQPGKTIAFNSCPALTAASVNHVLARCVANASFTGASSQVILDGAAPTGQGITDKATLIGRGCTVVTN